MPKKPPKKRRKPRKFGQLSQDAKAGYKDLLLGGLQAQRQEANNLSVIVVRVVVISNAVALVALASFLGSLLSAKVEIAGFAKALLAFAIGLVAGGLFAICLGISMTDQNQRAAKEIGEVFEDKRGVDDVVSWELEKYTTPEKTGAVAFFAALGAFLVGMYLTISELTAIFQP